MSDVLQLESARRLRGAPEPPDGELAISIGRSLGTVVVGLVGPLDASAATRLAATLNDLIEGQGNLAVAIDLRNVNCMAPSGLHVLSIAACDLERRGGRLSICGPPDCVLRAFQLARLARFVGPDEGEAKAGSHAAMGSISQLAARRRRDAHPAGSTRQATRKGETA